MMISADTLATEVKSSPITFGDFSWEPHHEISPEYRKICWGVTKQNRKHLASILARNHGSYAIYALKQEERKPWKYHRISEDL